MMRLGPALALALPVAAPAFAQQGMTQPPPTVPAGAQLVSTWTIPSGGQQWRAYAWSASTPHRHVRWLCGVEPADRAGRLAASGPIPGRCAEHPGDRHVEDRLRRLPGARCEAARRRGLLALCGGLPDLRVNPQIDGDWLYAYRQFTDQGTSFYRYSLGGKVVQPMTNPTGATEGDRVTSMVRRTHGAILWALAPYQIGGTSMVLREADPHWITVPRPKPHGVS